MADIVTQGDKLSITLTMYRADDDSTKTRTFSIDNPVVDGTGEQFRQKLQALQNFLLGDGATLIQPTGWRDDDSTENEYVTAAVAFSTSTEVETKWDTRLSRNLALSQTQLTSTNISEQQISPTEVTLTGEGITASMINVTFTNQSGDGHAFLNLQDTDSGVLICLVTDETSSSWRATINFAVPETGVYQAESVNLRIA